MARITVAPPLTISPPAYKSLIDERIVSASTTIVLRLLTSRPPIDFGTSGLGDTPTLTITRSTGISSIAPSMGTGERRPEASGSPRRIFCTRIRHTRPVSSPRYSIGLWSVINSTPSSLACFTSSTRAGISSSDRRYTSIALSAPIRRAVRTESIAVFPPPITATFLPVRTGVSQLTFPAPIRFILVKYSLLDITPFRFSPGIFMKRGNPAPDATKIPLKPISCKSSYVSVFPMIISFSNLTPIARNPSIS